MDNNPQNPGGRTRCPNTKRTLPRVRDGLSTTLVLLVSLCLYLVAVFQNSAPEHSLTDVIFILISTLLPMVFIVELVSRLLHAIEEYQHLLTRYENSILILFKDVFHFPFSVFIIAICSFFTFVMIMMQHHKNPYKLWYDLGPISVVSSSLGTYFLMRVLDLKCGPLYDSLWIENSNGLDYGSGMAHSFFHGYLKLVIPKTGTTEKHLEELMRDYEDKHHVTLEFYKLFILIPKSLYCPTSLMDQEYSPSIEESSSLDPKVITVAGVQNRVYKNSVYKIKSDRNRRIYVSAEYATPLKTFKDVVSFNGEHSNYYKKHKNDIVLQFYLTLKKVLQEHENCTNFCELIFYDDKDENGRYKDVGQILLNRIRRLKRQQQLQR